MLTRQLTLQSTDLSSHYNWLNQYALHFNSRLTHLSEQAIRIADAQFNDTDWQIFRQACFDRGLDCAALEANLRWQDFRLVAMDMDSTLITIECIDEIADMQGLKPQVAEITEAAMRGELDFQASLKKRVSLLQGLDASALQRVYHERLQLSPGAGAMLQAVQQRGLKTLLVSGGFSYFTQQLQQRLGLDFIHANQLEIKHDKLTGQVVGQIVDAEEKRATVERVCAQLECTGQQAIVMGDGANDLAMMSIAGLSVAFRAKPVVREQADIAFSFVGLDGLLALFED